MIEHLIVSTIVLALALLAARVLPLTARTRHAVLLVALAKFAIPTAVFRLLPIDVQTAPRIFGGGIAAPTTATGTRIDWIAIAWGAIAVLVFARWLLLRTRTISAALRSASPASDRELAAVADARVTLKLRLAVDVIRSPICEAPAVLRIVRPVIALPARGCDDFSDDELRSLVLHECAHVKRHDNAAALLQSLAASLLWWHPLVWLASRALTIAREEACDEVVADAMPQTDAYLSALTKVCHAITAPRTAGVSCMANAKMKERMEHLMSYETIRGKAWSHRAIVALGIVVIAASTFAGTLPATSNDRVYSLTYTVTSMGNSQLYEVQVIENATGEVVLKPRLSTPIGVTIEMETSRGTGREFVVRVNSAEGGYSEVLLEATDHGRMIQRMLYTHDHKTYDGEPVTVSFSDAEIHDVLRAFGGITRLTFDVDDEVQGSVTMTRKDVPWDKVLDDLLAEQGLVAEMKGGTVHVRRK